MVSASKEPVTQEGQRWPWNWSTAHVQERKGSPDNRARAAGVNQRPSGQTEVGGSLTTVSAPESWWPVFLLSLQQMVSTPCYHPGLSHSSSSAVRSHRGRGNGDHSGHYTGQARFSSGLLFAPLGALCSERHCMGADGQQVRLSDAFLQRRCGQPSGVWPALRGVATNQGCGQPSGVWPVLRGVATNQGCGQPSGCGQPLGVWPGGRGVLLE